MTAFARYAWSVLAYHVAVIAWGAVVRATGSGAGCGHHWPSCNGQVVPRSPAVETAIEFAHRATSGIAVVLVVALVLWARRALPRGHVARITAGLSLLFLLGEAMLGAGLVLLGWVAKDASAGRGWAIALHLGNTFVLLAALALTASWSATSGALARRRGGALPALLAGAMVTAVLAGVTGAVAALGDTRFPSTTFAEGLRQDFQGGVHILLRLRVLHPFAAIFAGAMVVAAAGLALQARPGRTLRRAAAAALVLVAAQLVLGVTNLLLLAPVPLQVVHLVLADGLWIALVLMAGATLAGDEEPGRSAVTVLEPDLAARGG
jgi:cytochrome c oxidase assembly protein subunit 15